MPIKITEALVSGFRPLKYGVNITLNIKDEDIKKDDRDLLEDYWRNGESVVTVIQGFEKKEEEKKNRKGYLAILMDKYSEKQNLDIEEEKKRLYKKYNITSRSELTNKQVDYEIESYKAGLNFS